jgi:hypothetical protein
MTSRLFGRPAGCEHRPRIPNGRKDSSQPVRCGFHDPRGHCRVRNGRRRGLRPHDDGVLRTFGHGDRSESRRIVWRRSDSTRRGQSRTARRCRSPPTPSQRQCNRRHRHASQFCGTTPMSSNAGSGSSPFSGWLPDQERTQIAVRLQSSRTTFRFVRARWMSR